MINNPKTKVVRHELVYEAQTEKTAEDHNKSIYKNYVNISPKLHRPEIQILNQTHEFNFALMKEVKYLKFKVKTAY